MKAGHVQRKPTQTHQYDTNLSIPVDKYKYAVLKCTLLIFTLTVNNPQCVDSDGSRSGWTVNRVHSLVSPEAINISLTN